ncbi:MAG: hypothetical protein PHR73_04940 [Candidatus Omnitrophica bacterium]|nr:hypothetical protein [Candidatus Omnitrophota bacterium]
MILFILFNLPLVLLSYLIAFTVINGLSRADRVLCASLVYFSLIIMVEQTLGIFKALYVPNILIAGLILLIPSVIIIRGHKGHIAFFKNFSFSNPLSGRSNLYKFVLSVTIGFGIVKVAYNLINPPFGWDSLNYHFTFAVEWLKHHNLDIPIVVSDNPCPSYFPINASLIYLWLIYPFKSVFLADLGQLPFFIMVFVAMYSISRKLGLDPEKSLFASFLFLITPNYFRQLSIAYVDVMVCAWFLMALNFLFILYEKKDFKYTLLFSLSVGMLIGTKSVGLIYSAVLILFFIYAVFTRHESRIISLAGIFTLVAGAISLGGYAYLQNFVETGNPLYPVVYKLFGKILFPGVLGKENFVSFALAKDYSLTNILFHEGLGLGVTLFVVPGLIAAPYIAVKKKGLSIYAAMLYVSLIFIYIVYRYVISLPNVRYIYPVLAIGFIVAFYAVSKINIPMKLVRAAVILSVLTAMPEIARHAELIISLLVVFAVFIILSKYGLNFRISSRALIIILLAGAILLQILSYNYNLYEYDRYIKTAKYSGFWPDAAKAWQWLNQNTKGDNIAYIGRPVPFPLYGTAFKNNVYYVSVNRTDPVKLHYFSGGKYCWGSNFITLHKSFEEFRNYRYGADYDIWFRNLTLRNTGYLFIYSLHQTKDIEFPIEEEWARHNPGRFRLVFSNNTIRIYEVLK